MNTKRALENLAGPEAQRAGSEAQRAGPEAQHAGPEAQHAGPEAQHAGPEAQHAGPEATSAIPETANAIPEATNAIPEATSAVPEATSAVPEAANAVPEATNAVPEAANAVPETATSVPEALTPSRRSGTASLQTTTSRMPPKDSPMMNQAHLDKWSKIALSAGVPADKIQLPFHILAGEALDVARFCQRTWEPTVDDAGKQLHLGLKSAVGNGTFSATMVEDLQELTSALQTAQSKYKLAVAAAGGGLMANARSILDDIRATLTWYFDDGKVDQSDAQLAELNATHANITSHDAMAAALFDFALLAELHEKEIAGLGGFEGGLIEAARAMGTKLREQSAGPTGTEPLPGERQAYDLRNRIGTLLFDKMQRARAAAKFVFRKEPELVREVMSAYERRGRLARLHRKNDSDAPQTTSPAPVAPVTNGSTPNVGPVTSVTAD